MQRGRLFGGVGAVFRLGLVVAMGLGILSLLRAEPLQAQVGTVYYVNSARPDDSGDGTSWATAKRTLQAALASASSGAEIWVAAGAYYPDEGSGQTDNSRDATFALKDGVAIYGGFAGTETLLNQRNVTANVTTLSGDLDQSGTANDNDAYHVISSDGNATTARLDGFTITGGNASGSGFPQDRGGGIYTANDSQARFSNLTISGNAATADGGGVWSSGGSPSFTNIVISGNTANVDGGGVYITTGSPTFTNVVISGNAADGGGGVNNDSSSPTFINVTISGNTADRGGGIRNNNSNPRFRNSIIWGNTEQIANINSTNIYGTSLVQGEMLGGTNLDGTSPANDPQFVNPLAPGLNPGGDYRLQNTSPARDVGNNANNSEATDLAGNPRIVGSAIDLGPYEVQAAAATPTSTPTSTPTLTATPVITLTATPVITGTATPVITLTATPTPTATSTPTLGDGRVYLPKIIRLAIPASPTPVPASPTPTTNPIAACTDAQFADQDGLVVIEIESQPLATGWSARTQIEGFTGDSYYQWAGGNQLRTPGNGLLAYQIRIDTPGTYRFQWRSRIAIGNSNADSNDAWLRFPNAADFYGIKNAGTPNESIVYPWGSGKTPNPNGAGADGWFKVFQNNRTIWNWQASTSDNDSHAIFVVFNAPGVYTMQISGRSEGFALDRVVLYTDAFTTDAATNASLPETRCTE